MNTDLRAQLVEYGRYHREAQDPVGLDEIVTLGHRVRTTPDERSSQTRRRNGMVVAIAAAALVLVLVGVIPVLLSGDGETRPVDTIRPTTTSTRQLETTTSSAQSPTTQADLIVPPQPLPPQTNSALDRGRLDWKSPNLDGVPGLGRIGGAVILGPIAGRHLVVVEEAEGAIADELLVSEDGLEFSRAQDAGFVLETEAAGGITFPATDATDVVVAADLLWLPARSGNLYRSTDGVTWTQVEFTGAMPIASVKAVRDQPIVRRGDTIVTTLGARLFVSIDEGRSFVEMAPFGAPDDRLVLTVGATDDEFFVIAAREADRVQVARSEDGVEWVLHPEPVDLGTRMTDAAYFGAVSGDDQSLFLVTDEQGPHIFRYSRNGAEIRIDQVAAVNTSLISDLGLMPLDDTVLYGISAHHWDGRYVLRREGPQWVLLFSDDGLDWRSVVLGDVREGGKPMFSDELVFLRGEGIEPLGDVLDLRDVPLE